MSCTIGNFFPNRSIGNRSIGRTANNNIINNNIATCNNNNDTCHDLIRSNLLSSGLIPSNLAQNNLAVNNQIVNNQLVNNQLVNNLAVNNLSAYDINNPCAINGLSNHYLNALSWINTIANSTSVPSGGTPISPGQIVPIINFIVPSGTVTIINGYCGFPSVNLGGIVNDNGLFIVPLAGRYIIAAGITFASVASVVSTDLRELYIYKQEHLTGAVTQLAVSSKLPIVNNTTSINLSTLTHLQPRDRIFLAVRQINSIGSSINTVAGSGYFALTRLF